MKTTLFHTKVSRLPKGILSRENLRESLKETKQMMAEKAGAVSHIEINWHEIKWQKVNQNVKRLQIRIVKATKEGKWNKVKALQHILTHSFSAKALAVRRVTENQGKRTAGVDNTHWDTPEKKATAITKLKQRGYKTSPLKRIYIPKNDGRKLRPISIPTMMDRAMQALYAQALDPVAETIADPNSYGFRRERSTADAIVQCYLALGKVGSSPEWIMEGDIQSCFDKISHEWLQTHIPMEKTILRKWLKAGFLDKSTLYETEEGTPQGGIISPVLARLALNGLEKELRQQYPKETKKGRTAKVNVVIYADDFIITASKKEILENEIKPTIEGFLKQRGLKLSEEKTKITNIKEGFDFLGQHIRKYREKLIIKPSKKKVEGFLRKVGEVIKQNAQARTENLIAQLNSMIRGWANYYKHVASKQTFCKIESAIFQKLWQWTKRRHPKKSHKWVRNKYFHKMGLRNWVLSAEVIGKNGEKTYARLMQIGQQPIVRHQKIRGQANPYDPEWELYFEERIGSQMLENLKGRGKLYKLWLRQKGICIKCQQKVTKQTGWNIHHLVRKTDGGKKTMDNLVLLHPNCHRQLHSQTFDVLKPCSLNGA